LELLPAAGLLCCRVDLAKLHLLIVLVDAFCAYEGWMGDSVVGLEAALGVPCPLTVLEQHWRSLSGERAYEGDFLAYWANQLLYWPVPAWVFPVLHISFTLAIVSMLGVLLLGMLSGVLLSIGLSIVLLLTYLALLVIDRLAVDKSNACTDGGYRIRFFAEPLLDVLKQGVNLALLNIYKDQARQPLVSCKIKFPHKVHLQGLHR
jgi:hypothetical protein